MAIPVRPSQQTFPSLPSLPSGGASPGFYQLPQPTPPSSIPIIPSGSTTITAIVLPTSVSFASAISTPSQASTPALVALTTPLIATPLLANTQVVTAVPSFVAAPIVTQETVTRLVNNTLSTNLGGVPSVIATNYNQQDRTISVTVNASQLQDLVKNLPSGAMISFMPSAVPGTGAPLTATITIKVDAVDSAGGSGQVIASIGAAAKTTSEPVVPGLVTKIDRPASSAARVEPPLAEQASTINDEAFLD